LTAIVLFSINVGSNESPVFTYEGIEYDDLVTRRVTTFSIPSSEIIPGRNCHKFTTEELPSLPQDLKNVMDESTRDILYPDVNGFYDGFADVISFVDAKKLLEKYDFSVTQRTAYDALNKINDTRYHFECIFEDDKYQYKLGFDFDSHYAKNERLVYVNVTKTNQGIPVIENQHVKLFLGGFNGTVIFNNKLGSAITLYITSPQIAGDWTDYRVDNKMTIPSGKVWSISPRNFHTSEDIVFHYDITPQNLQGTFTVKSYPACMTENEVKSLYSQVEVYPKFPSYVPQGYSFECGIQNTNYHVFLGYWNNDLREGYKDRVNAVFLPEFFADGGIAVIYYNEFAANYWSDENNYDKFEKAEQNAPYPFATTLTIEDEPAVMIKEHFFHDGKTQSFNMLMVFSDQGWYQIKSGLPEAELIKIAESLE